MNREGLKLVLLTRLSPAFPFRLLNLAYGLSNLNLRDDVIGLIAILPDTMLFCSLGALTGDGARRPSPPLGTVLVRRKGSPWSCCSSGWRGYATPLNWVPPSAPRKPPCCLGSAPALTPLAVVASRPVAWDATFGSCARPRKLPSVRVCGEQRPLKSTCLGAARPGWSGGQGLVPGNAMETA